MKKVACKSRPQRVPCRLLLAALLAVCAGACSRQQPAAPPKAPSAASAADPALLAQRQKFRQEQDATMRSELSPLSRIDYVHLALGEHLVGSSEAADVRVDAAATPGIGEVRIAVTGVGSDRQLNLRATSPVLHNGTPVTEAALHDRDLLGLGRLRLMVAGLPADPAVAIYDPAAKTRVEYQGLHYFPDDERYVTRARLQPYAQPRPVQLEASRGEPKPMWALGTLHFSVEGTPCSMEAYLQAPGTRELFLIFKDRTSGQPDGSYGAGRFLYAQLQPNNQVVLDFNQAWNPLCAYSPYFHCPLPPRSNWLPVAIPAGERTYLAH